MSRERYLYNAGEDTIHNNIITADTTGAKAKNWWYYNKKKLLFGILGGVLVVSFVLSIVLKVQPDYTIAVMTQAQVDGEILRLMENQLQPYCNDRNGDGKVKVSVVNYPVVQAGTETDAYDVAQQQAATVRFVADMSGGESMIWLHDSVGYYCMSEQEDLFIPLEGSMEEPLMMAWGDVKAFADMNFAAFQNEYLSPEAVMEYMSGLRVSFRKLEGSAIEKSEKLTAYFHDAEKVFENMLNGIKSEQ